MNTSSSLEAVIHRIHAATGQETGWIDALEAVRVLFCGRLAVLAKYDFQAGHGEKLSVSPPDEAFRQAYEQHSVRNPWLMSSMDYQAGSIMIDAELLRPQDLIRTDFYQHFLKQQDLFHRLCGVLIRERDVTYYLAIYRTQAQVSFNDQDKQRLQPILQHFKLALENHWTLLHARSLNAAIQSIADQLTPAVFLVDGEGQLLFHNHAADQILERQQGLFCENNHLIAATHAEQRALKEAIQEITQWQNTAIEMKTKIITVSNNTDPPLVISIRAIDRQVCSPFGEQRKAVVLIVKNPDSIHDENNCPLTRIYQLTSAQARLTNLILSGYNLTHAAKKLNVSDNTVRSHLKQVFLKTDTHSQMELVHLHAAICTDYL